MPRSKRFFGVDIQDSQGNTAFLFKYYLEEACMPHKSFLAFKNNKSDLKALSQNKSTPPIEVWTIYIAFLIIRILKVCGGKNVKF